MCVYVYVCVCVSVYVCVYLFWHGSDNLSWMPVVDTTSDLNIWHMKVDNRKKIICYVLYFGLLFSAMPCNLALFVIINVFNCLKI